MINNFQQEENQDFVEQYQKHDKTITLQSQRSYDLFGPQGQVNQSPNTYLFNQISPLVSDNNLPLEFDDNFIEENQNEQQKEIINKRQFQKENLDSIICNNNIVDSYNLSNYSPNLNDRNVLRKSFFKLENSDQKEKIGENIKISKKQTSLLIKDCEKQRQNIFKIICQNIINAPVIDPDNDFFIFWEILLSITILFCIFVIPIQFSLQRNLIDLYPVFWPIAIKICICIFVINILLRINTGCYIEGQKITCRKVSMKKYLQCDFIFECLELVPVLDSLLYFYIFHRAISILIMFKVYRIFIILNKYCEILVLKRSKYLPSLIKLFRLFFSVIIIAHFIATLFLGIALYYERRDQDNWLRKSGNDNIPWYFQYSVSFYWAITTMTSVGYGDITPANENEIIFTTLAMFMACFTFGYCINVIGFITEDQQKDQKKFQQDILLLSRYVSNKHISKELKLKVRRFMEYSYHNEQYLSVKEDYQVLHI